MGTEAFEATVADVQSERETRERERNNRALRVYRELVANGMSPNRANALVHSVFFADDPNPVTMTFVEHTGVFGLWNHRSGDWKERHDDSIAFGPRCVMQAGQRLMHPTVASDYIVREFAPDGTSIIEDVAPKEGG